MSLDTSTVGYTTPAYEFAYDWKTVVLYALGIGAKRDELDYLYESKGPKVYPTFAVVPAYAALGDALVKTQGNLAMVVHGGQTVSMRRPIPSEGTMKTIATITGIYDMKKMAAVTVKTSTEVNGEACFDTEWSILYRGAGSFGGPPPPREEVPSAPKDAPRTWIFEEQTAPEQALLYRLSGDLNPLHADPEFATMVGFPQGPILHGLCTYGYACRAIVKNACGGDAGKLKRFTAQFRKPVWPGEAIRTEAVALDAGKLALTVFAGGRDDAVITNAWAEIG
ncbi:MAG: MaoC family dehydratase N-terminal domain-containing protein [Myxococcales bacterium]|nr:MaoC family dehydratase N-terminal domain-containing protein [Myxococcales bacterium]